MSDYAFRLPEFEGPLDLLLQLIQNRELDITRMSLAAIADQYLDFITRPGVVELNALADYLLIAAKLILIKSRSLLPQAEGEEPSEVEDTAEALAQQLREYKLFKQMATMLREREQQGLQSFPRRVPPPRPVMPRSVKVEGLTFDALYKALRRTIEANPPLPIGSLVEPLGVSIQHRIETIRDLVRRSPRIAFSALLEDARSRVEIIVTFLAVLESIKRKLVTAHQDQVFGEIYLLSRHLMATSANADEDEIAFTGA